MAMGQWQWANGNGHAHLFSHPERGAASEFASTTTHFSSLSSFQVPFRSTPCELIYVALPLRFPKAYEFSTCDRPAVARQLRMPEAPTPVILDQAREVRLRYGKLKQFFDR